MNQVGRRISTLILFAGFLSLIVSAADVGGKWTGDLNTPSGQTIPVTFNFKLDGTKITGTVSLPMGDVEIADGKMDGETLQFGLTVDAGGQQIVFKCTGERVADDQLKITLNGAGEMKLEINAKRST